MDLASNNSYRDLQRKWFYGCGEKSSKSGQRAFKHTYYVRNQRQGVAFGKPVL